jgi:tetratricopeptide (TPR) repeat protein
VEIKSPQELAEEGKSAYELGEYQKAAALFNAAAEGFDAQADKLMFAEMRNNQSVSLLQVGEAQESYDVVIGTDTIFETYGDVRRQAMALGNQASALEALKRLDEAEEAYVRAAELLRQIGENDLRMNVLQALSAIQLRTGRQLEALATMQAGVESVEKPNLRQRILKKILGFPTRFFNRS